MHVTPRRSSCVVAAFAALAAAATSSPQSVPPQSDGPQRPAFRAGTNYVRVDVYPTRDGRSVTDLRQDEFEVIEDGVPQAIDSFRHILVEPAGPEATRVEPATVRDARDMAADPRARLFVLFMDTYHLTWESGYWVKDAFVGLLDRAIGQDDVVGVMTPEMLASSVTFGRRTKAIDDILARYFETGRRSALGDGLDRIENEWIACYGDGSTARRMIARRRERMTFEALEALVVHLGGIREERKAIFTVSEGWTIYRQDPELAKPVDGRAPGPPPVGVGPDGRLRAGSEDRSVMGANMSRCDQERVRLAQEDHEPLYRRVLDAANRANASFYAVDPRGLAAPARVADMIRFTQTQETLRTLSGATDGTAIVNTNDLSQGIRRAADDLTSYYLLGYSSSNTKLDGAFHRITVRVKRPGVTVRARRGYRAATLEEARARAAAAVTSSPQSVPLPGQSATGLTAALSSLSAIRRNAAVRIQAGYGWRAGSDGSPEAALWVAGELDPVTAGREDAWQEGGNVHVTATGSGESVIAEADRRVTPDASGFLLELPASGTLAPGDYTVHVTSKPIDGTAGILDTVHVLVPRPFDGGGPGTGQPILFRRGPFSGRDWVAAGDLRFRRPERVRVDVSVVGAFESATVRLLDRAGSPLNVPVTTTERGEGAVRWVSGELALAPLTFADYLLEITLTRGGTMQRALTAIRIVP